MEEDEHMINNESQSEVSMDSAINNINYNDPNDEDAQIMMSQRQHKDLSYKAKEAEESSHINGNANNHIDIRTDQQEDVFAHKKEVIREPKEETKIGGYDSPSDEDNIEAVPIPPPKKSKISKQNPTQNKNIEERNESNSSSEGNEIEAIPNSPLDKPKEEIKQTDTVNINQSNKINDDSSSSSGNEIEAVANSPVASEDKLPVKKKSKKKKRLRVNEYSSDQD